MRHHHLLAAAAGASLFGLAACSEGRAEASGPAVSRTYQVGAFTGIEVAGPFDVTVTTGRPVAVSASGPPKLVDALEAVVENGVLKVRTKKTGMFSNWSWSGEPATVTVSVPMLQKAGLAGSGDLNIDRVTGDRFEGGTAGSGDLKLGDVRVKELKLGLAGSGGIAVRGQAERVDYGVAGSGSIDASGLTAVRAKIGVAGSGDVNANVTGEAEAGVVGSGDIRIQGGAKCTSSTRGSGDISCS